MALAGSIDRDAHDGMAFADEHAPWAWPRLPNRSHRLLSIDPVTLVRARSTNCSRPATTTSRPSGRSDSKKYGYWRGFVDSVVARYLDCGTEEAGFARLRCDTCGTEKLLTLSCKQRGICPSCDAKRAAAFAALLKDELLENVVHCLWTFTIPKMLRPYFMYRRELLGDLVRLAYETIHELMSEAAGDHKARPGVVAVPQTFGSVLNVHPHAHCIATV